MRVKLFPKISIICLFALFSFTQFAAQKFVFSSWTPTDNDIYIVNDEGIGKLPIATSPYDEFTEAYSNGYVIYSKTVGSLSTIWSYNVVYKTKYQLTSARSYFLGAKNEWVVYFESDSLWTVKTNGTSRTFISSGLADVNGYKAIVAGRIIFSTAANYLYTCKLDGTELRLLVGAGGETYEGAVNDYYVIFYYNENLYSMPADASMDRPYLLAGSTDNECFRDVSDGKVIYIAIPEGFMGGVIYSVSPTGTNQVQLSGSWEHKYLGKGAGKIFYFDMNTLYSIYSSGSGRVPICDYTPDAYPFFEGVLGSYLIFSEFRYDPQTGRTWYDAKSVLIAGGNPLLLAADMIAGHPGDREEYIFVDTLSAKVIINRFFTSSKDQKDIKTVNANGTGLKNIAVTGSDELFSRSTASRYLFTKRALSSTYVDLHSILFSGSSSSLKTIANNAYRSEWLFAKDCIIK